VVDFIKMRGGKIDAFAKISVFADVFTYSCTQCLRDGNLLSHICANPQEPLSQAPITGRNLALASAQFLVEMEPCDYYNRYAIQRSTVPHLLDHPGCAYEGSKLFLGQDRLRGGHWPGV
jgi:hypothetical protein